MRPMAEGPKSGQTLNQKQLMDQPPLMRQQPWGCRLDHVLNRDHLLDKLKAGVMEPWSCRPLRSQPDPPASG
ncbi:hypothetical protein SynRCC2555_01187 [Synechococcus sp. WH 8101]|nr:hypothetical protein SynRCC2555_01187 [Synechococcus sp. WH 8101]